ncbi:MFS transporter [uncultured Methanosphaera sp.]|uniref:MFS transporter n=1 Tax=uncultured Methanosphaera sp. TaxID=262501 RepID=UPI002803C4A1|nr:MFS transporter [uncultured Methanosphaera sp.]
MQEETINKYIIIVSIISSFAVAFTSNAVSVALPIIAHDLNISNIMQNWIVSIYLLIIAAASVPFGKICVKYGLKLTYEIGLIVYMIGAILSGMAPDISVLIISRIIQALGSAILFVNGMALITAQLPENKRGQSIGFTVTGVYIGLALAPTISGILSQNVSWRSVFYVTIPLTLISLFLLMQIKKEWKMEEEKPIDIRGSLLYVVGIILLMYGFTRINESVGIILFILGILVLAEFIKYELKIKNPIYEIRLFKNKIYTASNIASLISYFATFVVTYILNYHFQYIHGLDPQTSGIVLVVTPVIMAIIAPISGRLSDKYPPQIITAIGMGLVTIALFILTFLDKTTPFALVLLAMILQGVGFGFFSSPNSNIIMSSVDKDDVGTASASLSTVRTIGQSFSLGLLTVVFAFIMGNVPIIPSNYHLLIQSSQMTMAIATFLCLIAVFLSLKGLNYHKEKKNIE